MLFDKAVIFTDIHLGNKNNSRLHNQDCEDFIIWMIDKFGWFKNYDSSG